MEGISMKGRNYATFGNGCITPQNTLPGMIREYAYGIDEKWFKNKMQLRQDWCR